jgi:hypothetical protein
LEVATEPHRVHLCPRILLQKSTVIQSRQYKRFVTEIEGIGFSENVIIIDVGSVLADFLPPIRNSVMPSEL